MMKANCQLVQMLAGSIACTIGVLAPILPSMAETVNVQSDRSSTSPTNAVSDLNLQAIGIDPLTTPQEDSAIAQNVTSVSQLSDVRPTDWAFTALQSLVERYGCIAGYPDRTFRGNQATSRYEFAAGLNACLDKINEIISAGLSDKVSKEDLATLQKLQEEFAAELATLRGRVDALDAKVAKLEAQQFSTTTKLSGEAIFGAVATSGGPRDRQSNIIFGDRIRLVLNTSFTGKDLLRTRLEAGNLLVNGASDINPLAPASIANVSGTNMARFGFASGTPANANTGLLNLLFYRFPVFDGKMHLFAGPIAAPDDFFTQITPFASSGQGSISRFGRFDPFFRIGGTSTLIGAEYRFSDRVNLQVGYSSGGGGPLGTAATPAGEGGLFGGVTSIAAQFLFKLADNLDTSVAYANTYLPTNSLNTGLTSTEFIAGVTGAIRTNLLSGNLVWRMNPSITFSTSGTVIFADSVNSNAGTTFTTWTAGLNFNNLFSEGSVGGILFGQPLKRNSVSGLATTGNTTLTDVATRPINSTPYHLELFYRYRLNKFISITPGVYWVFNPEGASANSTATVGLIRTTFSF
ncbi:MAG: iron uptake porin [Pseudanabaenaceae cyanobacterium bins.39]|nr:iron uptake porin [Pseudanabaenaceae cyanobacterium bins.39]